MRLPAILRLPADPNHRLAKIKRLRMAGIAGTVAPSVLATWMLTPGGEFFVAAFACISLMIGGIVTAETTTDRTWHLSPADRAVPRRLFSGLATACEKGMTSTLRHQIQDDLVSFARILRVALGQEPWVVVERLDEYRERHPEHLLLRGQDLARIEIFHRKIEAPNGSDRHDLQKRVAAVIPLVVSVARDFGLNVSDLVAPISRVPGQRLDKPVPVEKLAAPVHRLAQEWTSFDRATVDDVLRIAADAAAGAELDDLERRWLAARADASPEDVDALDRTFLRGAAGLSATIADAIAARARHSRDALTTMTRFIETKHAA